MHINLDAYIHTKYLYVYNLQNISTEVVPRDSLLCVRLHVPSSDWDCSWI